jgi:hypothetical protein
MRRHTFRSSSARLGRDRAVRPGVEGLEGRILQYATTGNHFAFGSRITWSIVPDGTDLAGKASNLQATLNGRFGTGNWQRSLQDAFAVWENVANVNLVQVSDDGSPTNAGNYQQGSPSIGDIRIGGFAQATGVLGFCLLPPPSNGGSDAGDVFLNSSLPWQIGSDYDLESVMIHEVGHALGLAHSSDASASMYEFYNGVHQYVGSDDVAGVQAVWGPRWEDGFALGNSNFVSSRAADVTRFTNSLNHIVLGPLDVASASESYWFKLTTPANASSTLSAVVQSTSLSELSPKVQIYDAGIHGLAQASASANSYGAVIGTSIFNATPNTTYYIKVSGSNAGPTGTGNYALLINMGNVNPNLLSPPNTVVYAQPDKGGAGYNSSTGGVGPQREPGDRDGGDQEGRSHDEENLGRRGHPDRAPNSNASPDWINVGGRQVQGDYFLAAMKAATPTASPNWIDFLPGDSLQANRRSRSTSTKRDSMELALNTIEYPSTAGIDTTDKPF